MGREQTQKGKKYGTVLPPEELPPVQTLQVQGFVDKFPLGNPRGKTTGFNVFGIGGTKEYPNPYKTQAQKDFSTWTQETFYNIVSPITGGISPFSGRPLQVPQPASPTGNGNGNGNGTSDKCQECDAWDVQCELGHMFAGTCTPPVNGNGNGKKCTKCDSAKCKECDAWDIPCETGHLFAGTCTPPEKTECDIGCVLTGRGCDCGCKDVKPCTTCDSAVCVECNAWDLQCEDCKKKDGTCTPPTDPCGCLPFDIGCQISCWWEKNKNYVYIIGGIIGLGILLWLLRPLFGIAKNITGN